MSRLAPLELRSLDAATRAPLEEAERAMEFLPNDGLTMARVPGLPGALLALVAAVYGPGRVGMETKRLVALMSSAAAGCAYCRSHARFGGLRSGITTEKLHAIRDYERAHVLTCSRVQRGAARRLAAGASCGPAAECGRARSLRRVESALY